MLEVPVPGARRSWILTPSSGEGVGRHNVSDTKDTGSPVGVIYQTHLRLYPPSTQVFLTSHGHPSLARHHQDSDSARQTPGVVSSRSLGGLVFYKRGTISDTTYLNFKVSILADSYKTFGEYF